MTRSPRWDLLVLLFLLFLAGRDSASAQWVLQQSGTNAKLTDVVMLDSLTALCVGDSGKILKTTDAGVTWATKYAGWQQWNGIAFVNPSRGLVVGNRMAVAASTDGGETWSPWAQAGPPNLLTVAYVGMASVFIGSDSGNIFFSHNGGNAWEICALPGRPISCIFGDRGNVVPADVYAVTPSVVYKSTDLGVTWAAQLPPMSLSVSAYAGAAAPNRTAFVVGTHSRGLYSFPVIFRRTPQDTAWVRFVFMPPELPCALRDVVAPTNEVAYACGWYGVMFKTNDGGNFWGYHSSGTQRHLNAVHFLNERRGFAVGDSGTILFTANGGVTSVTDPSFLPRELVLYQNFPNPFNPTTTITYTLSSQERERVRSQLTLKVYDLLGREVATLVNGVEEPGSKSVEWNAAGMASGVYFYRLSTAGFTQTKKLILAR